MQFRQFAAEANLFLWKTTQQMSYRLWDVILKALPYLWIAIFWVLPYVWKVIHWGFPQIVHWLLFYLWKLIRYKWAKISMINQLMDLRYMYCNGNDKKLNQLARSEIELKPHDVKKSNKILRDVVIHRIIDYMKIKDDDFNDLFENILYGGSFYKNLKVNKPDEYDLCLMIDLSRSIDSHLIEVEANQNIPTYVKIKLREKEFKENEKFWFEILNESNYLDQNKFRQWIDSALTRALEAMSGGFKLEGYVVKHQQNTYTINVRPTGPAFTLSIIRKNDWVKTNVDLVPCLVFRDYILPGFRPHKDKTWIAIAKPLKHDTVQDKELLWRTGFYNDEKRLLAEKIKPVIKLVKKLRDVHNWIHLKSYFIETLFLHELDDPIFRFCYPKFSRLAIFMYMLRQLQKKLEKEELLDYWHEGFNLLDKTNAHSLVKTAKELQEIIRRLDNNINDDDDIIFKIFDRTYTDLKSTSSDPRNYLFFGLIAVMSIREKFFNSVSDNV